MGGRFAAFFQFRWVIDLGLTFALLAGLGAPDDRLVGVISVVYYLALIGVRYTTVRRRGATRVFALAVVAVVASLPHITLLLRCRFFDAKSKPERERAFRERRGA